MLQAVPEDLCPELFLKECGQESSGQSGFSFSLGTRISLWYNLRLTVEN